MHYIIIESYFNDFIHISSHEELWEAEAALNRIYKDFIKASQEEREGLNDRVEKYLETIRVPEFDPASSYWRDWVKQFPVKYIDDPDRSTTPDNFKAKLSEKLKTGDYDSPGWTGNPKTFKLGDLHIVKVP